MVYTVATKPEGEAMLIGYTNDLATHQTAIDSRKPADGSTFPKCQSSEPVRFDSELARLSEEEEDDVMQPVPGSSADGGGREEHEPKREVRDLGKPKVLMRLRLPSRYEGFPNQSTRVHY
ncbi:hypothetical protein FRC07_004646 [Ceratobasidium sp. 392]|nr:hypothetical protein FRC07_004646 [Ceratobasidium sp. 392]